MRGLGEFFFHAWQQNKGPKTPNDEEGEGSGDPARGGHGSLVDEVSNLFLSMDVVDAESAEFPALVGLNECL